MKVDSVVEYIYLSSVVGAVHVCASVDAMLFSNVDSCRRCHMVARCDEFRRSNTPLAWLLFCVLHSMLVRSQNVDSLELARNESDNEKQMDDVRQ